VTVTQINNVSQDKNFLLYTIEDIEKRRQDPGGELRIENGELRMERIRSVLASHYAASAKAAARGTDNTEPFGSSGGGAGIG